MAKYLRLHPRWAFAVFAWYVIIIVSRTFATVGLFLDLTIFGLPAGAVLRRHRDRRGRDRLVPPVVRGQLHAARGLVCLCLLWPIGLAVTLAIIALTIFGRAVTSEPGRPFRVSLRQFWFGLAAVTIASRGVVVLVHR